MDNVIDISSKRKPKDEAEICFCDCGSCEFYIYDTGAIQCVECDEYQIFPWMDDDGDVS